jgi:hypothetical protein
MARKTVPESTPPTLPPHRAVELLRRQLEQFDKVNALRRDDPELKKWMSTTGGILDSAFGKPHGGHHEMTGKFKYRTGAFYMNQSDAFYEQEHHKAMLQKKAVLESCIEQLELLAPQKAETQLEEGRVEQAPVAQALDAVLFVCDHIHIVARQLSQRRENRPTLTISDEYDVQDLLHALLRLHFDDVRPEEWTPSYGGKSSRMDFLLKEEQIVVEAKMTRSGLGTKEVAEQLIIDAAKYREHPDCKTLVCLVYDPSGLVKNPRGIERDLSRLSGNGLEIICIITP